MEFLKKNYKYIIGGIVILIIIILSIYFSLKYTENIKKEDVIVEDKNKEDIVSEKINYYYVDVKGAVNSPGVYKLEEDKRVIDAINLAGGLRDDSDTSVINLSKKIKDEMCIVIYTKDELYKYKSESLNISEKLTNIEKNQIINDELNDALIENENNDSQSIISNINSKVSLNYASKEELLTLTGIGESKADAIIKYREENGEFKSIEDIKNVSGIGNALYEKIKDNITL